VLGFSGTQLLPFKTSKCIWGLLCGAGLFISNLTFLNPSADRNTLSPFLLIIALAPLPSQSWKLAKATREKGGTFVHAKLFRHREYPSISLVGAALKKTGLVYGDLMLMRYEYGFIRMRKVPANTSIVTSRLCGDWLNCLGFSPHSVMLVGSSRGLVDCKLQANGQERTHELVAFARRHKLNLLQVTPQKDNDNHPQFEIPLSRLEKAGLTANDSFFATYEYGRITLRQIDFDALGF